MKTYGIYTVHKVKMMGISQDSLQEQIPYYLTQPQKEGLKQALRDFYTEGKSVPYYTSLYNGDLLQGDGRDALQIIRFKDGERKIVESPK